MKSLIIAWKDLLLVLRDPTALVLMLAAPLALTLVVAFALGGLGGGGSTGGMAQIPVLVVNHDTGQFSSFILEALQSDELADLLQTTEMQDESAARAAVDADQYAAVVVIPAGFSDAILPTGLSQDDFSQRTEPAIVTIYASPNRRVSAGVVRSVIDTILSRFSAGSVSGMVTIANLVQSGRITVDSARAEGEALGRKAALGVVDQPLITVTRRVREQQESGFDFLKYMAPSMAILYLMFTMTNAGRTLLTERDNGTLTRMLVTPSHRFSVLGGKMLGVFLTGLMQMAVVLIAGSFLFNISWGPFPAVALLTLVLVGAASGWGILVAAFSRTPGQASTVGTAINLSFAALGGNFVPRFAYPEWMKPLGYLTPNAWGIESYFNLIYGSSLVDILPAIISLFVMSLVLFAAAVLAFRRQYS